MISGILHRPPAGRPCGRCGEELVGRVRMDDETPVHAKCVTLQEWNQALRAGLWWPGPEKLPGGVGPVSFTWSWDDYEEQSAGTPTRDEAEHAERGILVPLDELESEPEDEDMEYAA